MNTRFCTTLAGCLAGCLATPALAYHGSAAEGYVGADALFWQHDPDGAYSGSSVGLRLRGGWLFSDYLGVEAQLGTGGEDHDRRGKSELDLLAGAYAKLILPIEDTFHLYALGGVAHLAGDFSTGDHETGLSAGVGAEMGITPHLAIGADYMRYADDSDMTFDAVSFGLVYHY